MAFWYQINQAVLDNGRQTSVVMLLAYPDQLLCKCSSLISNSTNEYRWGHKMQSAYCTIQGVCTDDLPPL